jgi:hypothetical protein
MNNGIPGWMTGRRNAKTVDRAGCGLPPSAKAALRRGRRGQATAEFATMLGLLMLVATMLALLLYTFKEYGGRVLDLAGSEFP